MDSNEKYLNASHDDIVFEKRNKSYGGYFLRQGIFGNTIRGVVGAILFALLITVLLSIDFSFLRKKTEQLFIETPVQLSEPPALGPIIPPAPAVMEKKETTDAEMEVKADAETIDKKEDDKKQDSSATGNTVTPITGNEAGNSIGGPAETGEGAVYAQVDKKPIFQGGNERISPYISSHLVYPKVAKDNNIKGTVMISFVVNTDGSVSDVKVKKGIGGGCDEEAIKVVKEMPKWTPAERGGHPVRCIQVIPIDFKLSLNG